LESLKLNTHKLVSIYLSELYACDLLSSFYKAVISDYIATNDRTMMMDSEIKSLKVGVVV